MSGGRTSRPAPGFLARNALTCAIGAPSDRHRSAHDFGLPFQLSKPSVHDAPLQGPTGVRSERLHEMHGHTRPRPFWPSLRRPILRRADSHPRRLPPAPVRAWRAPGDGSPGGGKCGNPGPGVDPVGNGSRPGPLRPGDRPGPGDPGGSLGPLGGDRGGPGERRAGLGRDVPLGSATRVRLRPDPPGHLRG